MSASQIFISYAREDQGRVEPIYRSLKQAGYKPWLDREELLPGQDWELEITQAIRQSKFFLACLSRQSLGKTGFVQKELKRALDVLDEQPEGQIYLLPVRLEPCDLPIRFAKLQWCDAFEGEGLEKLLAAIAEGLKQRGLGSLTAEVLEGPGQGQVFRVFSPLISVGRGEGNDIRLDDPRVSGLHAKIESRNGRFLFRHLGEKTFSVVRSEGSALKLEAGKRETCNLNDGDRVLLGGTTLRISLPEKADVLFPEIQTTEP